jgi:hypothetical protein
MKKLVLVIFCFALLPLTFAQTTSLVNKGVEGVWKCWVPDAPYQYQNFNIQIDKANDQFTAKLIADGGMEMPLNNVSYKDSTFEGGLYVENTAVTLKLRYDGNLKLKGTAVTDQGDLSVYGDRVVPVVVATDSVPAKKQ